MADGYPLSPVVMRGAIVQLVEQFGIPVPNIVPFQYNPAKITRTFTPWNPFATSQQNQAAQTPLVQPFDPEETYRFELEFDAADDIELPNPIAMATGVASRLAAMRKLIEPTKGLKGDLLASANALGGNGAAAAATRQAERPVVPITLLILGTATILPVRVTSISTDITSSRRTSIRSSPRRPSNSRCSPQTPSSASRPRPPASQSRPTISTRYRRTHWRSPISST
jgi:hypothetical protein